ncbi:GNAT family N-acetyltransferase [Cellulophaga baltica]|uniref:GNAT family N-acetyltransferase n=1 Tax=Cellulophaga baltica TaxID=76594 RepID=UPI001C071205|nr:MULTISPECIES: GNAT family N-acetyltransferase [Cellulophaga]MBU2998042.1 GNAT family N-acetyltransferase [Cellulophaga baltica]MDO6769443.1 GNAT family N-acetyltransferase [Cellulophaga sp. 1_MG-2023]
MNYHFRKATVSEIPQIWEILKQAIQRRKEDGSNQWQDGYPNLAIVTNDVEKEVGYVLCDDNGTIIGYSVLLVNDEPEYEKIEGEWLTNEDFVVFHRVAISEDYLGRGFAKKIFKYIEDFALTRKIYSLKVDTNFDNAPMLNIFDKLGYTYCGEVYFRGSPRKAYEKKLS